MKRATVLAVASLTMFAFGGALMADDEPCYSLESSCPFSSGFCTGDVTICDTGYVDRTGVGGYRGPLNHQETRYCRYYDEFASFITIDCGSSPAEDAAVFTGCILVPAGGGKLCCWATSAPNSTAPMGSSTMLGPSGPGCLN